MPLQKLALKAGVNRENTTYANEGGWYESDKIRFRSGQPEKVGGWVRDGGAVSAVVAGVTNTVPAPPNGALWGICRSMWNWVTLAGNNLLSLGTNLKFYIQDGPGGSYYDVTPTRKTSTTLANAFTTTNGSNVVVVTDPAHGAQSGDFVTITATSGAVNGIPAATMGTTGAPVMYQITYLSNNTYSIVAGANATSAGTSTATATFAYELTSGNDIYTTATGWGAGGWGGATTGFPSTGWGQAAATGLGANLRFWSQSDFGENLVFNPCGGGIYLWAVSEVPNVFNRAQLLAAGGTVTVKNGAGTGTATVTIDATCPSVANYVMVSDASRFIIAFGTNDPTGLYATTAQDPMQIRWSDQESYATWTPAITNQAGDYRLSHGSSIYTAFQARQEILVFTDSALYVMQYVGAPYVWGFQLLEDNISIIGPNAVASASNMVFWMGTDKFYVYNGRVQTLPSTLREYVFSDINLEQGFQVNAGTNEGYSEVWWTYCSTNSQVTDRYVIFNYLDNVWYYGTWVNYTGTIPQGRTFWLDSALRKTPMAAVYGAPTLTSSRTSGSTTLVYHETGTDDAANAVTTPIVSYVQSSDFDIGDGHNFGFVWRLIPDLTFDGSYVNTPSAYFTVRPRTFPGANYGYSNNPAVTSTQNYAGQRTYTVQQFTEQVYVRIRGRQMAFKVSAGTYGSLVDGLGVQWQLGVSRIDVKPDGRR